MKLEFKPLTADKLTELYKMKFSDLAGSVDESTKNELSRFNKLTPGDLHAEWSRMAYQDKISHVEIMQELKREASFKQLGKRINL